MYDSIFIPWYADETLRSDEPLPQRTDEEQLIVAQGRSLGYEIDDAQLAWRRAKIAALGSERWFRMDYPSTPEDVLAEASGLVVPGLRSCIVDALPFDLRYAARLIGAVDFGYADPTAIVTAAEHDSAVYVFHVYRRTGGLPQDHVREAVDRADYCCDPSRPDQVEGYNVEARAAGLRCRFYSLRREQRQEPDWEWTQVRMLVARGALKIVRSASAQIVAEAEALCYDPATGKPDQFHSEEFGHFDVLDALRYLLLYWLQTSGAGTMTPKVVKRKMTMREELACT